METTIDPELDALGRWIKTAASLSSIPLKTAPAAVARPVILWETASRRVDRRLDAYTRVEAVKQFGKLYVNDVFQSARLQRLLLDHLEEIMLNVIPVYAAPTLAAAQIGRLKRVDIIFDTTASDSLDIPVTVSYEAALGRVRPEPAPHAVIVGNRITTDL